jgi:peptidyl-prolyl cis-trans isomerase D
MMQFFRSIAKPLILVTAIAFFIWLVVDLSGLSGGGGLLTRTSVGKVNGESVDIRTFQASLQQAIDLRQRQTGASLSLEEVQEVSDQVWEQAIQEIIFRAEYDRYGIRTSPEEVAEAIRLSPPQDFMQEPSFQTDGRFDPVKYQSWLASTAAQELIPAMEQQYRTELLRGKLLRRVIADVVVSDAALWERYRDEHETVRVGILQIDPAAAVADAEVQVTPQDVENYYRAHREEFSRPRLAYVSYLTLPREPDASDSTAALERIRALRQEIQGGAPFAEVARRESSDTVSGREGGELGELAFASVDSAFAQAARTLPLRTLSEPVRSSFGYHLIQVDSRTADRFTARHLLVPIEVAGRHREVLDARADSLEELAAERLEPSALDTASRALRLPIGRFGPLAEGVRVSLPEAGAIPDVSVWAFQAQEGEESPVIEAERAFMVFRLDSLQQGGVPPLRDVRNLVENRVRLEKKREVARGMAARLAERGGSLAQLAQGPGVTYREHGPVARLTAGLPDPALIGAAFGAPVNGITAPIATDNGVFLLQGLARTPADSAEFVKNQAEFRQQALQSARQSRIRAYVTALRESARVTDRRAEVFRTNAQNAAANVPPVTVY